MTMNIMEYDLADACLLQEPVGEARVMIWRPDGVCVVLGQSNKVETSLLEDAVVRDGVPVYKRPSGGETVVLSHRMLVISVLQPVDGFVNPRPFFDRYNQRIVSALTGLGVPGVNTAGISDICIGPKKILGSSIYRTMDKIFYHGVLNVGEDIQLISRYLKHPPREPEYRNGRSHEEFVTSILGEGLNVTVNHVKRALRLAFDSL